MLDFREIFGEFGTRALQQLQPEVAHDIAMKFLSLDPLRFFPLTALDPSNVSFQMEVPGIGLLPHPVGLAAGFDKNAVAVSALTRLGFSSIEIGAVTPLAQAGNPRPRLFRYRSEQSLINRMGFNNDGIGPIRARLKTTKLLSSSNVTCPLGVNIGKNKDTVPDAAIDDFLEVHAGFKDLADFFVINLSSPNTPGLRDLATPEFIGKVARQFGSEVKKTWIKFDPDMNRDSFQKLIEATGNSGLAGLVLTNTHRVKTPEVGGLSGRPLLARSNTALEWAWDVHRGKIPMIGVGGILTGGDIVEKISRGASAVQIYTALAYRGPWVVASLLNEAGIRLRELGFASLHEAYGSHY
jgi:dihydroorotate dehydrogenase